MNLQNEVSHDQNQTVTEPETFLILHLYHIVHMSAREPEQANMADKAAFFQVLKKFSIIQKRDDIRSI